jgi:nucleoid-associated protein YgaU
MGLISFMKNAGAKLFGKSDEEKNEEKAAKIVSHLKSYGFNVADLDIAVDDETITLAGEVDSLITKNRLIVAVGNVEGITKVDDRLVVKAVAVVTPPEPEKQFYSVVSGDTLSKIAKQVYGNANKYPVIFEANTPMLKHPDKIYPGQVLVIPPLD